MSRDSILGRWRHVATRSIPDVRDARALWEQDQYDPDAKAWRETRSSIEWQTQQTWKASRAIEEWHHDPVQSLVLRTGLKKTPDDLAWLEKQHADSLKFLEGNQRQLQEQEQNWATKKRLQCQQLLEREGDEIRRARRSLEIIDRHQDHFRQLWQREEEAFKRHAHHLRQQRPNARPRTRWLEPIARNDG